MTEVGNKVGNKVKTMDVKTIVPELCEYTDEQEWFEFKVNWFEPQALGNTYRQCRMLPPITGVSMHFLFGVLIMIPMKSKAPILINIASTGSARFWRRMGSAICP